MTAFGHPSTHNLLFGSQHRRPVQADRGYKNMAAMDAKTTNYNRPQTSYSNTGNLYGNQQYANRGQQGQGYGMHHNPQPDAMAALAHGFQGMNMNNQSFAAQAKNAMMSTAANPAYGGLPVSHSMPASMPASMYGTGGQYMFPNSYAAGANTQSPGMYTPHAAQYMPQLNYAGYQQHDNSPASQNWTPTTGGATGEVPTLITPRRDSISSNENDQPTTPSYAGYPYAANGVAINRSPSGVFTHSTPSPTSMIGPYGMSVAAKQPEQSDVSPRIKMLVTREPAIPRAIPAPSSPLKPLDRALENQRGETNVYIRGLLPETTDEMLESWGTRFGDIKSSKSIIDLNTGLCKGFGFVKYHNYEDAENCIRGFHYLGYEVSFARESFYSKLKTFSDEANTNLYVSNLPKSMNEHELANLFQPHKVCSSRILRDKNGHGRGVGFARFESREDCEEVIKTFNNHTIKTAGEELQVQIRYADTQEQKSLKQQTQAARQFRSAEYEYATQAWRQGRLPYAGSTVHDTNQNTNEFDQYLGTTPAVPIQGQRWAQSAVRQVPGRSPLGAVPYTNASQPAPVQINAASDAEGLTATPEAAADSKPATTSPATAHAYSPVISAAPSNEE
ncbi:Putative RNA recognition motif domain, nucleotide-binding alpha-beta plait domain superfamily [Septoria linicola]|uniref:RNA recognition motif domain, nucleotide-binding alpha-beta plait domain superfamily n=1 Tax=Septoria linicola TaxID=215465 RepID=A0A9Q9ENG8_9PEZI|nr:Putative RNA recognition motif domain, nucleotide-binding alpha-beta plait domain superfamily [Septoria linicola]